MSSNNEDPEPAGPLSTLRRRISRSNVNAPGVPPRLKRFQRTRSEHMLPSSGLSPSDTVFSNCHRLVARDLPFEQSRNRLSVLNQHSHFKLMRLLVKDWFHIFLRIPMVISVLVLLSFWTLMIIVFAGIYMRIDRVHLWDNCGLAEPGRPIQFGPAFAFSLETCTTVGYGLPNGTNAFFESRCSDVITAIYFQMVWSMLFNAILLAFVFQRLAKCENRGVQVLFSRKAIIGSRPESNKPFFQFRLFDVDATHPVVESHVRLYLITQRSPVPLQLRITNPNDDLGGMLFLSLPSEVVHEMDAYSTLRPPVGKPTDNNQRPYKSKMGTFECPSLTCPHGGLALRQVDGLTNNRDDVTCPVCGEAYGTVQRLIAHGKFNRMTEAHDEIPYEGSHQEVDWEEWETLLTEQEKWSTVDLKEYFEHQLSEVLCVVEGIDPLTSGTFQAVHSYQIDDIHWGCAHFADCVCINEQNKLVVDMDFFHQIKPLPDKDHDAPFTASNLAAAPEHNTATKHVTIQGDEGVEIGGDDEKSEEAQADLEQQLNPSKEGKNAPHGAEDNGGAARQ